MKVIPYMVMLTTGTLSHPLTAEHADSIGQSPNDPWTLPSSHQPQRDLHEPCDQRGWV